MPWTRKITHSGSALADASTNPVAHQVVDHIGELFAVLLKSVRDAQKLEHADPLPKFVDLLTEDSLWPDDEEDDELRWEEEEVFSDSMFYSFWFYTKEVLTNALNLNFARASSILTKRLFL